VPFEPDSARQGDPNSSPFQRLSLETLDDLHANENEILRRIGLLRNGGQLFLIHPLMTLAEVGVDIGQRAEQELLELEPIIASCSPVPYRVLRETQIPQHITVNLLGLFRRGPA
jgi:hypothetical protein